MKASGSTAEHKRQRWQKDLEVIPRAMSPASKQGDKELQEEGTRLPRLTPAVSPLIWSHLLCAQQRGEYAHSDSWPNSKCLGQEEP